MTPLSRSEFEAAAFKSARGAGMDWGLAEEAAFAALWLADHGIDGLTLLARHLGQFAGSAVQITGRVWRSPSRLCPIAAGAGLGDHFHLPQGPLHGPVTLSDLSAPALILPFLAASAARTGAVVLVQWPGVSVVVSGAAAFPMTGAAALLADHADAVTVTAATAQGTSPCLTTPPATWQSLQAHVQRSYVPASDQSRREAGAAGSDNA